VSWLGKAVTQAGRYRSADLHYARALNQVLTLRREHPNDLAWLKQQIDLQLRLAEVRMALGSPSQGLLLEAQREARYLTRADPENVSWLASAIYLEAALLRSQTSAGSQAAQRALDLLDQLAGLRMGKGLPEAAVGQQVRLLAIAASAKAPKDVRRLALHQARASEALSAALARTPDDFQLLAIQIELLLLKLGDPNADTKDAQSACGRAAELLSSRPGWLQSHVELTRSWIRVQRCLRVGEGSLAEVKLAEEWVQTQRER
jgi:hypothetical protein